MTVMMMNDGVDDEIEDSGGDDEERRWWMSVSDGFDERRWFCLVMLFPRSVFFGGIGSNYMHKDLS